MIDWESVQDKFGRILYYKSIDGRYIIKCFNGFWQARFIPPDSNWKRITEFIDFSQAKTSCERHLNQIVIDFP